MKGRSVAIIGSFRQYFGEALRARELFVQAGFQVTTPKGTYIIKEGIPFVRFESDASGLSDSAIQTLALHRIFRADLVFVVVPQGYVGRTTCYEIGRLIQARRPLYLSDIPIDLPIEIPPGHILSAERLVELALRADWEPEALFENPRDDNELRERDLLDGLFGQD